jgi:hypothetical protein
MQSQPEIERIVLQSRVENRGKGRGGVYDLGDAKQRTAIHAYIKNEARTKERGKNLRV